MKPSRTHQHSRGGWADCRFGLAILLALAGRSVVAQESTTSSPFLCADWERLPPTVYNPRAVRPAFQKLLTSRHEAYGRFVSDHPGRWLVLWNEDTGAPHRLIGEGLRIPLRDDEVPPLVEEIDPLVRGLLGQYPDLFPVEAWAELEHENFRRIGGLHVLDYRQTFRGVPVYGTRLSLRLGRGGRVIDVISDLVPTLFLEDAVDTTPTLRAGDAVAHARAHLAVAADPPGDEPRKTLWIVPLRIRCGPAVHLPTVSDMETSSWSVELRPCLTWEVRFPADGTGSVWSYFVAARSNGTATAGALLGRFDHTSRGTVLGTVTARATPGVLPDTPWNPPVTVPLGRLEISRNDSRTETNANGSFAMEVEESTPVRLNIPLRGKFCEIDNDAGDELFSSRFVQPGIPVKIVFNVSPTEFATAQVNTFIHVNRAHDLVRSFGPGAEFDAIDVPVLARVNLDDASCLASFTPEGNGILGFDRSDPCVNMAYSTWVTHEYGHFVAWKAYGDRLIMPAYNEGMADVLAALATKQPIIGRSFDGVPPEGPDDFTYSRDLSQVEFRYPVDLLRDPHDAGLIVAHAFWSLLERLRENLGPEAATNTVGALWLGSLLLAPPVISADLVLDLLVLDDDDDDVFNGTPHDRDILDAFREVGLYLPGEIIIEHDPIPDSSSPDEPATVQAQVSSLFEFSRKKNVTLHYSTNGMNSFTAVELERQGLDQNFTGEIPAHPLGTTIHYYLEASADSNFRAVLPDGAPREGTFVFAVANLREVYAATQSAQFAQWTHGMEDNGFEANQDDWQWGVVVPNGGIFEGNARIDGNLVDPPGTFSGDGHWGNDLSIDGSSDKLYPNLAHNFLHSPELDCRGFHGIHLRFRRWLSAESGDSLRISINGTAIYQSPGDRDVFDHTWKLMDYDISALADDRDSVTVRFELESNGSGRAGGWNVDDVRIVATRSESDISPAILDIQPRFDSLVGGSPFTLRGVHLKPDDGIEEEPIISFGGVQAWDVVTLDAETVTGVIPPRQSPGMVTVFLSRTRVFASLPGAFTYFGDPVVTAVAPPSGDLAGGAEIRLVGRYFTDDSTVTIDGSAVTDIAVFDSSLIAGTTPPGRDIGPMNVTVTTRFGETTSPGAFTYSSAPLLLEINPVEAPVRSVPPLFVLFGDYFPTGSESIQVYFGERPATEVQSISRKSILGVAPPSATPGPVDVTVVTPLGTSTLPAGFVYFVPQQQTHFVRGDSNFDGSIDISDSLTILGFLFNGDDDLECDDAADVNDDGELDVSDPVTLLDHLFGGGPAPPAPHPATGVDPTEDLLGC